MSSPRGCCALCAVLARVGGNLAVVINVHQESVNGTRGQSALLPVSYGFHGAPQFPVAIRWMFPNSSEPRVACTVLSCSLGAGGAPHNCSAKLFPDATYRGRAELFPQNGSLLLRDLRLSDSGVYTVAFRPPSQTRHVTLTVHESRPPPQHPGEGETAPRLPCYVFGTCYCLVLLVLQLLFHLRWHRGNSGEVSNAASRSVPGTGSRRRRLQPREAPPLG